MITETVLLWAIVLVLGMAVILGILFLNKIQNVNGRISVATHNWNAAKKQRKTWKERYQKAGWPAR